jgi:hypothetical protein
MENTMTQAPGQFFEVAPEFKKAAMTILADRPFAEVSNQMAILRKDTHVYHLEEMNTVIGYLGDLPYGAVSKFFDGVKGWVKEFVSEETTTDKITGPESQVEVESEVVSN